MSKKAICRNEPQNNTEPGLGSINYNSTDNIENSKNYVFFTPMKKIKIHPEILETPKKEKINLHYENCGIIGKNLLDIFKSM